MKVLFKFLLFTYFISSLKGKKTLISHNKVINGHIDECQRCKVLIDSFKYWLDKTSRGKFEGGDTAWEEAKLKSYARSEVRLVEIQEGLCSELNKHQDYCYTLAEETESLFEKWWGLEHAKSVDLYTWVCIENLKYCCPKNHFGIACDQCPMDKTNKVCGGHGICDGDGTRKGNGTCLCHIGYQGKFCEDCAKNFYTIDLGCEPCHKVCNGCTNYGPDSCIACKKGWEMESGICLDVNECLDLSNCKDGEYCTNSEGSYKCNLCDKSCKQCIGEGTTNCTACDPSAVLWSGKCVDDTLKSKILKSAFKRVALYVGFLVIILFILRYSKKLTSIIVVIVAVYIYLLENMSEIDIVNLFVNLYLRGNDQISRK